MTMVIRNKRVIALISLVAGIGIIVFYSSFLYRMMAYSINGEKYTAEVIGYKVSGFGAKKVDNASGSSSYWRGRSPWFQWKDSNGIQQENYSRVPQILVLFNYSINENIDIAYPKDSPEKALVLSWKEIPGLLFMIVLGLLFSFVGFSMIRKQKISA